MGSDYINANFIDVSKLETYSWLLNDVSFISYGEKQIKKPFPPIRDSFAVIGSFVGLLPAQSLHSNPSPSPGHVWRFLADGLGTRVCCCGDADERGGGRKGKKREELRLVTSVTQCPREHDDLEGYKTDLFSYNLWWLTIVVRRIQVRFKSSCDGRIKICMDGVLEFSFKRVVNSSEISLACIRKISRQNQPTPRIPTEFRAEFRAETSSGLQAIQSKMFACLCFVVYHRKRLESGKKIALSNCKPQVWDLYSKYQC